MPSKQPLIRTLALAALLATAINGGVFASGTGGGGASPLEEALDPIQAEEGFQAPAWPAMKKAQKAFRRVLAGKAEPADEDFRPFGFALQTVRLETGQVLAVTDPPSDVRGRGFYVIDRGASTPVLVQAPHRFKDLDTGAIVAELVAPGGFRAAAWNTVPRWAPDDRSDRSSDVAHIDASYFNAFTRAFAEAYPAGVVVQIHGFARGNRDTAAGRRADVIVSSGTRRLQGPARAVHRCLDGALDATVLGYGETVFELGATTNRNAAALRRLGFQRFVHVEMVRDLRRRALAEPALQERIRDCLLEAAP